MQRGYRLIRPPTVDGVTEMTRGDVDHSPMGHPAHWHREWQLVAVTRGDGWVEVDGTSHRTPSGSLFLVPPEVVHSNGTFEDGCAFRSILIDPTLVHGIADAAGLRLGRQAICAMPVYHSGALVRRFESFHRQLENRASVLESEERLENWLLHLLGSRTRQMPRFPTSVCHPAARRARECLWSRADEALSLSELAEEVGLSRFELSRQFKAAYGMPPHAWQIQVRVGRAKELLKKGVSPGDVAFQLGFSDQAHLGRVFRKATGFPPARFQAEFRKIVQDPSGMPREGAT